MTAHHLQSGHPQEMQNGHPVPSDTDLFGTPSRPATPDVGRVATSDLREDLMLSDLSVINDEETGTTQTQQFEIDTEPSTSSSSSSDTSSSSSSDSDLSEAKQDLSFHHTPEAANIDWLSWTKGSSTPLTLCRKRSLGLDIH